MKYFIFVITIFTNSISQSYADDRMPTLVSIIGGVISAIGENSTQPSDTAEKGFLIQYSARVEEIQRNLKSMNLYHGAIDGLNGSGTQQAIKDWRRATAITRDGDITDQELHMMGEDVISNTVYPDSFTGKSSAKLSGGSLMTKGKVIIDHEYGHTSRSTMYGWCMDYKNKTGKFKRHGSNALSVFLDGNIESNYKKYHSHYEKYIYKTGKCMGFNKDQTDAFRSKGKDEYINSNDYIMNNSGVAGVVTGAIDEEEFVDNCNETSRIFTTTNELDLSNIKQCR